MKTITKSILTLTIIALSGIYLQIFSQKIQDEDFRQVVEKKLLKFEKITTINGKTNKSRVKLEEICPIDSNIVARRIFLEYGAIFVAKDEILFPTHCVFADENAVQNYQSKTEAQSETIDGIRITLQKAAMTGLLEARDDAAKEGLRISPRGGSLAAKRSFQDTARLWDTRFYPALNYWMKRGKISRQEAEAAKTLGIQEQVEKVLEWEDQGFYFSKDFSKSILFSVAAPGASQHIFMVALDVQQFANKRVREILADHGWFQTVKSDAPHFTYLGVKESKLPSLGLKSVTVNGQKFWIPKLEQ